MCLSLVNIDIGVQSLILNIAIYNLYLLISKAQGFYNKEPPGLSQNSVIVFADSYLQNFIG